MSESVSDDVSIPQASGTETSASETIYAGTNVPAPVTVIEQGFVNAVPAVWADQTAGPLRATLWFRVGEADERLRTRGRCHLVRALVLDALDSRTDVEVTSSVRTLRSSFTVSGDDNAVVDTLNMIGRAIATLRTDRVDTIAPGLVATWQAPETWETELLSLRFGSRGYGLSALPLLGLNDVDPSAFSDWVRTWYNAHNAVVSLNRPAPVGLNLGMLGDGIPKPLPEPHQVEHPLPGLATGPDGRVALSVLGRFDARTRLLFDVALDRLHRRATTIDPDIPRPEFSVRRTGPYLATVSIAAHARHNDIPALYDAFSAELFTLSMVGPTADELGRAQIAMRRRRHASRATGHVELQEAATDLLYRENHGTSAALRASSADLAKILRHALPRSIWLVPEGVQIGDHRITAIPMTSAVITGDQFSPLGGSDDSAPPKALVLGTEGVTLIDASERPTTVFFDDIVTLECHPDGTRVLWSADGTTLRIDTGQLADSERIRSVIDSAVAPWVILPVGDVTTAPSDAQDEPPVRRP